VSGNWSPMQWGSAIAGPWPAVAVVSTQWLPRRCLRGLHGPTEVVLREPGYPQRRATGPFRTGSELVDSRVGRRVPKNHPADPACGVANLERRTVVSYGLLRSVTARRTADDRLGARTNRSSQAVPERVQRLPTSRPGTLEANWEVVRSSGADHGWSAGVRGCKPRSTSSNVR
jgi:hypothetical protein